MHPPIVSGPTVRETVASNGVKRGRGDAVEKYRRVFFLLSRLEKGLPAFPSNKLASTFLPGNRGGARQF